MAMDMLRRIAASPLPAHFNTAEEIDKIKLLRAAGLVIALTPPENASGPAGPSDSTQVLAITAKGREELARFELPCRSEEVSAAAANSWKARLGTVLHSRFFQ